jgi:hypothetical protein
VLPPRQINRYTRVRVLEAVHDFKLMLSAGETPTDRRYRAFSHHRPGVPSLRVIKTHGGLATLLADLAHPEWRARALTSEEKQRRDRSDEARKI